MKIDLKQISCHWSKCNWMPMLWRLEAIHHSYPSPIGQIWALFLNTTIKQKKLVYKNIVIILDTFVIPQLRRQGIRTLMQKEVLGSCDCIVSGGSSDVGRKFMIKQKYKINSDINMYVYKKD